MPFELALLRALLAACAAALLAQALPALDPRLLDKAPDVATVPVARKIPRLRLGMTRLMVGLAGVRRGVTTESNFQTGSTMGPQSK